MSTFLRFSQTFGVNFQNPKKSLISQLTVSRMKSEKSSGGGPITTTTTTTYQQGLPNDQVIAGIVYKTSGTIHNYTGNSIRLVASHNWYGGVYYEYPDKILAQRTQKFTHWGLDGSSAAVVYEGPNGICWMFAWFNKYSQNNITYTVLGSTKDDWVVWHNQMIKNNSQQSRAADGVCWSTVGISKSGDFTATLEDKSAEEE